GDFQRRARRLRLANGLGRSFRGTIAGVKRLFRILLKAATVLSLLLCVAAIALWLRSYFVVDSVRWNGSRFFTKVSTSDCTLELWLLPRPNEDFATGWSYANWPNDRPDYVWGWHEMRA